MNIEEARWHINDVMEDMEDEETVEKLGGILRNLDGTEPDFAEIRGILSEVICLCDRNGEYGYGDRLYWGIIYLREEEEA